MAMNLNRVSRVSTLIWVLSLLGCIIVLTLLFDWFLVPVRFLGRFSIRSAVPEEQRCRFHHQRI